MGDGLIHFVWLAEDDAASRETETACGLACQVPAGAGPAFADFRRGLKLTTMLVLVSCRACEDRIFECQACGLVIKRKEGGSIGHICSKVCSVCGHPACPCCGDWCDMLVGAGHDELCCDGKCTYEEN